LLSGSKSFKFLIFIYNTPKKIPCEPVQEVFWTGSLFLNRFMRNWVGGGGAWSGSRSCGSFEPVQKQRFSKVVFVNRFTTFEPVHAQMTQSTWHLERFMQLINFWTGSNVVFLESPNYEPVQICEPVYVSEPVHNTGSNKEFAAIKHWKARA
jgi:hypothetical protein